jgi:hypothetical protein
LEPGSVPASQRFRGYDDESFLQPTPKSAPRDPEDTINQTQPCSGMPTLQSGELLTESYIFDERAAASVKKVIADCKKDQNQIRHGPLL